MRLVKILSIILLLLLVGTVCLPAQEEGLFAVNRQVIRVWESALGYRVIYRASNFQEKEFLVPTRWIYSDKIALVSFSRSSAAPFLQVYYGSDQQILFFKLVLPRNSSHSAWGYDTADGLEEKFASASLADL